VHRLGYTEKKQPATEELNMSRWALGLIFFFLPLFLWAQSNPQIYINGTVAMADGTPLPSAVQVYLKCRGSVLQSVYTSGEGRFSFSLNQRTESSGPTSNTWPGGGIDASIGGPSVAVDMDPRVQKGNIAFKRTDLSQCHCEALLAGYTSDLVRLGVRSPFDDPDVGFINLYPLDSVQGSTISVTTAKAPKRAMEAFEDAKQELTKENAKRPDVIKHLEKAIGIYPEFAEAWQFLGEALLMEGKETEAGNAFQKALEADPLYLSPYGVLAELKLRGNEIEEAARLASAALELNPYVMSTQYIHAIAQYYLGNLDSAVKSLEIIHTSREAHLFPTSHRLLGSIYAERRDYASAAEEFRTFLATDPPEGEAQEVMKLMDDWEKAGLLISAESG
jgi:Tfp pilus assembly protein PilF